jgi:Uma2 family endonuclease
MVEIKFGSRTVDVPYMIQLHGVTPQLFDELLEEDTKAELMHLEMFVYSPHPQRHEDVAEFLRSLMRGYTAKKGLGSVLRPDRHLRIKEGIRVCPDLFFLTKDRVPNPLPKEYKGVPDLILELLSISNYEVHWREKSPLYEKVGVKEIWFVDPNQQQIIIDRLRGRYYVTVRKSSGRVESTVLEGFWIKAEWLWTDPLPDQMQCLRDILG